MMRIESTPTRRGFLRLGGLLGLSLPTLLRAEAAAASARRRPARNVILLWLGGGPATIDMWDLKPEAPEAVRGEFRPTETSLPGLSVCEHLPETAQVMHKLTLVRSLKHSIPAHGPGGQYVMTGHLPSAATEYPSMGSVTARMLDATGGVPPYVTFGNPPARGAGFLGSAWNSFDLQASTGELPRGVSLGEDADMESFDRRIALRNVFDRRFDTRESDRVVAGLDMFHRQAVDVLRRDSIRRALDVDSVDEKERQPYGTSVVGRDSLRALRLVQAGARFVTVGMDGWDTHVNNFRTLRDTLLPRLDQALSALVADLDRRGMLDETIVCCCGEFGRTPTINGTAGRDHWSSAMSLVLAGGGFKQGHVHGATDKYGNEVIEGALTPADLAATLLHRLGIDPDGLLETPSGRTMPIIRDGRVAEELFA